MTDYPIYPSSQQLTAKRSKYDFPWNTIDCGQSFMVDKSLIKGVTLRPLCSIKGKELGKKFKMVEHNDCYEVGRVK